MGSDGIVQKKKEEEKEREKELNDLFKVAITQPKVPLGAISIRSVMAKEFFLGHPGSFTPGAQ